MTQGKIIFYDEAFIENLNRLKELLETHDRAEIHRFLIDRFGFIFKMCQYYAKHSPEGVPEFEQADEARFPHGRMRNGWSIHPSGISWMTAAQSPERRL